MYAGSAALGARSRPAPASRDAGAPGQLRSQGQRLAAAVPGVLGPSEQRSTGAYTLIAPNETRRHQMQRIAEQELASLEKWKEQNRAKPVYLLPRRLGGSQSESEVRQKQQLQLMQSKYQQKLKREEYIRIKKEAEEAELQKMKAIQREKSNKLEEKRQLQEEFRKKIFMEHHQYKTAEFLTVSHRRACQSSSRGPQTSTWGI
ncbi:epithelial-stromal interaction protein 1 [Octodon degus]|uniref:Epithelial-stromal interaction protein 1 n=1 Tax=Octodon degus TaxID=10160 RepID=A0A6P6D771_OCTDE|nr:epithelial-stromal interaction protein 1 [Octodon degus]